MSATKKQEPRTVPKFATAYESELWGALDEAVLRIEHMLRHNGIEEATIQNTIIVSRARTALKGRPS